MHGVRHLLILIALAGTCALSAARTVQAEPEAAPAWTRCLDAVPWRHAVHTPNMETRLLELAMSGKLEAWSKAWIAKAIAEAPPIDELLAEAKDSDKLLFWYVPSVAGQQVILPHFLDRYVSTGMLSDPEVVQVLRDRCVCLKLPAGGALAQRFGLTAPDVIEPAFLLLKPDGTVLWKLDRVSVFDGDWFLRELCGQLPPSRLRKNKFPNYGPLGPHKGLPGGLKTYPAGWLYVGLAIDSIRDALRAGDREHASARLGLLHFILPDWHERKPRRLEGTTPGEYPYTVGDDHGNVSDLFYEAARVFRRRGEGARAAHALAWARIARSDPATHAGDLATETGLVAMRMGRLTDARRELGSVLTMHAQAPRAAEAAYWLGVTQYFLANPEEAQRAWEQALTLGKDRRGASGLWAAKASACLAEGTDRRPGESAVMRAMFDPRWPVPAENPRRVEYIRSRAFEFLLLQQRANGMFWGPRWGGANSKDEAKPFNHNMEIAITALAASAIDASAKLAPKRAKAALERAEAWLLGEPTIMRGDTPIWTYADAFRLAHFSRRIKRIKSSDRNRVKRKMNAWIKHLVEHQGETGGPFKHFSYTSTFVTASVKLCLHEADAAGFDVPAEVYAKADAAILGARDPQTGLFGYRLDHPSITRTNLGAAQRGPLCELALFRTGQADESRLRSSVETYTDHFEDSARKTRKANFHIPSIGNTAGYYFWHDFYYACRAAREGGSRDQRGDLRALWRSLPEPDGSFIDSGFSYGKAYGTAMALLSIEALGQRW